MTEARLSGPATYWERVAESRWGQYITARERATLLFAMGRTAPGNALEVGCEGGRWSALLHTHGWSVVCTDVDAASLARCEQRIPDARCVLVSPDDETLPLGDSAVDLLLVYEVHQVIEASWFPAEAARVLTPGGLLVCSYWNSFSYRGAAYRALATILSNRRRAGIPRFQGYYEGPSYRSFRGDLERHGFTMLCEEGLCWFPFTRNSDSKLIGAATTAESALGLRRLPAVSPWVLCVAELAPREPLTAEGRLLTS